MDYGAEDGTPYPEDGGKMLGNVSLMRGLVVISRSSFSAAGYFTRKTPLVLLRSVELLSEGQPHIDSLETKRQRVPSMRKGRL